MSKDLVVNMLKENGCRITKQRLTILDVILNNDCSCCKEIYYKASQIDDSIGVATVYRMVNVLEEIGVVSRRIFLNELPDDYGMDEKKTIDGRKAS